MKIAAFLAQLCGAALLVVAAWLVAVPLGVATAGAAFLLAGVVNS